MSDSYKENLERYLQGLVPQRPSELQKMEAYTQPQLDHVAAAHARWPVGGLQNRLTI
ncbi:MAG: hypothetical protein IT327_31885 [Anaerolineae bacterium]|nr:hypothetical protein [Anaerolineae bacterium]